MKVRGDICSECPFLRTSAAGWLGRNNPVEYAAEALSDQSLPCHTSMKQDIPHDQWLRDAETAPRCRGAITMMRNNCKLPRDSEMIKLVKTVPADHKLVFSNGKQFIDHHQSARVQSWEFEEEFEEE